MWSEILAEEEEEEEEEKNYFQKLNLRTHTKRVTMRKIISERLLGNILYVGGTECILHGHF